MQKLEQAEITRKLGELSDWSQNGDQIERKLSFPSFMDAIAFINRIAELADDADHHPEIFNVYDRVELVLTTHDAAGLTEKDFALAAQIDAAV